MDLLPAIDLRGGGGRPADPGRLRTRAALRRPGRAGGALHRGRRLVDPRRRPRRGPHRRPPRARGAGRDRPPGHGDGAGVQVQAGGMRTEDDVGRSCSSREWRGWCWARPPWRIPRWPARCARRWPGRVAVGLDYRVARRRGGRGAGRTDGWPAPGLAVTELLALWAGEPVGAVVATAVARDGMLDGPRPRGPGGVAAADRAAARRVGRRVGHRGPLRRWRGLRGGRAQAARRHRRARRSSRVASAWRRRWPRAQRPADPLPRRRRGPGRQGRALRRPHRRGRPGRAGGALRRRGRRRGHVPRHHGLVRRARHHGLGGGPHGGAGVHPPHRRRRRARGRRRTPPPPGRGGQGGGEHGRRRATGPRARHRGRVRRAVRRRGHRRPGAARTGPGWEVYTHGGRRPTGVDAVAWAVECAANGAGEILLTSMDRDGTRDGFDLGPDARRGRRRGHPRGGVGGRGPAAGPGRRRARRRGRRRAGGVHLPPPRVHDRRGQGLHGRPRGDRPPRC